MADTLKMLGGVRHRVIDRTAQEVLAVVEFGEAHTSSLVAFCPISFSFLA